MLFEFWNILQHRVAHNVPLDFSIRQNHPDLETLIQGALGQRMRGKCTCSDLGLLAGRVFLQTDRTDVMIWVNPLMNDPIRISWLLEQPIVVDGLLTVLDR